MGGHIRLDDKFLLIALLSLASAIILISLDLFGLVPERYGIFITISFIIYIGTFILFLFFNHRYTLEIRQNEKKTFGFKNPYKPALFFSAIIFLMGLAFLVISKFNWISIAVFNGGLAGIIYSAVGWHDIATKSSI